MCSSILDTDGVSALSDKVVFVVEQAMHNGPDPSLLGKAQIIKSSPTAKHQDNWMALSLRHIAPCKTVPYLCGEKTIIGNTLVQGCVVVCGVTNPSDCAWHTPTEQLGFES